jgi:Protein of unknown function (DUF2934)
VIVIDPNLMARIRQRAYEIWEDEGRPEGRERIHWVRAEAEFRERLCARRFSTGGAKLRLQKSREPSPRLARTDRTH